MRSGWFLALALAACSGGELPVVEAVTPNRIAPAAAAALSVQGGGFVNALRGSVDDQPFVVSSVFDVTVGALAATLVTRVDDRHLSVLLPPLDVGRYDVTVRRPDGRSASLAGGLTVGADDAGIPDDLAAPPDLRPSCHPPALSATVGPGPNLMITLDTIKLDGGNQVAEVAAGAQFSVSAHYSIKDSAAMMNIDQILLGVAPASPQVCLVNAIVSGTKTGTATVTMTAPSTPGTYTLRFHYGQATSCDNSWWTINGAPTAAQDFAAICVP